MKKVKTLVVATMLDPRFKSISFESELTGAIGKDFISNAIADKLSKEAHEHEQQRASRQHHSDELNLHRTEDPDSNINKDIWSFHESRASAVRPIQGSCRSKAIIEFNRYTEEDILNRQEDPLVWWKANSYM